jgi:TorA maturation chaperone TorD
MPDQERATFCQVMASCWVRPDADAAAQVCEGALFSLFRNSIHLWRGDESALRPLLAETDRDGTLKALQHEFDGLFSGDGHGRISLVESCYKPWTRDRSCILPFASSTGLLMGDPAGHLAALYQACGLKVPEEFAGCPDHLVLVMEFLSHLYRWSTDSNVAMVIEDHLDWIPLLKKEVERVHPKRFYDSLLNVLVLFLNEEAKRLETKPNEKKVFC